MAKSRKNQAPKPKFRDKGRGKGGRGRLLSTLKWSVTALVWLFVVGLGFAAYYAYDLPDVEAALTDIRRPSVTVLAADGTRFANVGDHVGATVGLSALPPYLPKALIAVEDRRFYDHGGVDWLGIGRAMLVNLRAGAIRQGGSTITQQAAKNLFLTSERTVKRKVQELMLALWMERRFTKDQILTIYLNRVYFGAGTYGVQAAAERFFGVKPSQLSLYEAAVLVGALKAPSRLNPHTDAEAAARRAQVVLDAMMTAGQITPDQAARARRGPLKTPPTMAVGNSGRYFTDWVVDQLPGYVGPDAGDITVLTTIDPRLQRAAERAVARAIAGGKNRPPQAAVTVIGHDGAVRAMVGGLDYGESQFNRAVLARRQPGSAFKPFVYLAALDSGLRPDSVLVDGPVEIGGWKPRNITGTYVGHVSAAEALVNSINTVAVKVAARAGIDNVARMAERLGITSPLRRTPSLALGTSEVGVLELTAAYGALATGGVPVWPFGIVEIRDRDGAVIYRRAGDGPSRVVPARNARIMTAMLSRVMSEGTGRAAALDRPAAGKTGTSQDNRDAWFVGYTADFVAGVWVGHDDGAPMKGVTGGGLPARIWRTVMGAAHEGLPRRPLAPAAEPGAKSSSGPGFWQRLMDTIGGADG